MKKKYGALLFLLLLAAQLQAAERWEYFVPGNDVRDVAFQGDYIWCATRYSIVRWDRRDMSYIQFTGKDYGENSYPEHLAVDSRGNLWVGILWGSRVVRFDGVSWTTFDQSGSRLPGGEKQKILADRSGNVWFAGFWQDLKRFDGVAWQSVPNPGNLVSWKVYDMAEDQRGAVWLATNEGLTRFDGFSWRTWTSAEGLPDNNVQAVAVAPDGNIWCVTGGKLCSFDGKSVTIYPGPVEGEWGGAPFFQGPIAVDEKGTVWACSGSGDSTHYVKGLWSFRDGAWEHFLPGFGKEGYVTGAYPDRRGTVWYITSLGLASWDGRERKLHRVNAPDHIGSNQIITDQRGVVWLASANTAGVTYVARYDQHSWKVFAPGVIPEIGSMSIQIDTHDRKWFLVAAYLDGDSLRNVIPYTEFPDHRLGFVVGGDGSTLWFGSENSGLFRWKDGIWTNYTTMDGLPSDTIIPLAVGPNGILWCSSGKDESDPAGGHGIAWFDGSVWREYEIKGGAITVAFGRHGEAWFGTYSGILRFSGGQWTKFTDWAGVIRPGIQSLALDKEGNLWTVIRFSGALRYDGREWKRYTTADGLLSNTLFAVGVDAQNRKWFATDKGYCVLDDSAPVSVSDLTPASFALLGNYPNPFNPNTTISFTLPVPGKATLTVYDITGRKVRTLVSGTFVAGVHSVVWDGKDGKGEVASSGVYLTRLQSGKAVCTAKMIIVK